MRKCAHHGYFQISNDCMHVTYLLDTVQINDTPLQADMDIMINDTDT